MSSRIIILEDDLDLRQVLAEALEDEGYEVHPAANSAEAINIASKFPPDLLITDVRMKGMDGLECLAHLRSDNPNFRCIVITGYADRNAPTRAMEGDADDYLYKPFSLHDFLQSVEGVLKSRDQLEGFRKLLGGVLAGARFLWEAGTSIMAADIDNTQDKMRDKLFRNFYVGIRSGDLTQNQALHVWDQLEPLEARRQALRMSSGSLRERQALTEEYHYLADKVIALCRRDYVFQDQRTPDMVDRRLFAAFFRRLKVGAFNHEQVKLAPFLRTVDEKELRKLPQVAELHREIWAEPDEE